MDERRSPSELAMYSLLVTIGAQHIPAGEAYQVRVGARSVNGAHQLGRAINSPPVPRLSEPNAGWREIQHHQVEKGAHSRDQRDEQDTLYDDFCHMLRDI